MIQFTKLIQDVVTSIGGSLDIDLFRIESTYEIATAGSVILTSNYSVGTTCVLESDERVTYKFRWNADLDADVNNVDITIFGKLMPTELAAVPMEIKVYWDGAQWDVSFGTGYEKPVVNEIPISTPRSLAVSTTLVENDFALVTTGLSTITLTLPSAASKSTAVIDVKKVDAAAGKVVIAGAGIELIDGQPTVEISGQYNSLTFQSDGVAAWYIK